jgi:hypothetical protein
VEVPQVRFNEAPKLTQRLQFIQDTKKHNHIHMQSFKGKLVLEKLASLFF